MKEILILQKFWKQILSFRIIVSSASGFSGDFAIRSEAISVGWVSQYSTTASTAVLLSGMDFSDSELIRFRSGILLRGRRGYFQSLFLSSVTFESCSFLSGKIYLLPEVLSFSQREGVFQVLLLRLACGLLAGQDQ